MRTQPQRKDLFTTVAAMPGETADATMIVTTASPDRVGDRVITTGLDTTRYQQNPVLCWSHDHDLPPIGSVTSLTVGADRLTAAWKWNGGDEFAGRIRRGWDGGFIRAASIGFRPTAPMEPNDFGGYDFPASELLEISLCAVPCNAEAVRQLKSAHLWPDDPAARVQAPVGGAALRRALADLRSIRTKAGRVLSALNAEKLRNAVAAIQAVLAQLDGAEDGKALVVVDGAPLPDVDDFERALEDLTAKDIEEIIAKVVIEQLMQVTGRLD